MGGVPTRNPMVSYGEDLSWILGAVTGLGFYFSRMRSEGSRFTFGLPRLCSPKVVVLFATVRKCLRDNVLGTFSSCAFVWTTGACQFMFGDSSFTPAGVEGLHGGLAAPVSHLIWFVLSANVTVYLAAFYASWGPVEDFCKGDGWNLVAQGNRANRRISIRLAETFWIAAAFFEAARQAKGGVPDRDSSAGPLHTGWCNGEIAGPHWKNHRVNCFLDFVEGGFIFLSECGQSGVNDNWPTAASFMSGGVEAAQKTQISGRNIFIYWTYVFGPGFHLLQSILDRWSSGKWFSSRS